MEDEEESKENIKRIGDPNKTEYDLDFDAMLKESG